MLSFLFPRIFISVPPPTPDHCDRTYSISIGSYKNIELYKNDMYVYYYLYPNTKFVNFL